MGANPSLQAALAPTPIQTQTPDRLAPSPAGRNGEPAPSKYDLVANVVHEGKAGEGLYRVHIHRKVRRPP